MQSGQGVENFVYLESGIKDIPGYFVSGSDQDVVETDDEFWNIKLPYPDEPTATAVIYQRTAPQSENGCYVIVIVGEPLAHW